MEAGPPGPLTVSGPGGQKLLRAGLELVRAAIVVRAGAYSSVRGARIVDPRISVRVGGRLAPELAESIAGEPAVRWKSAAEGFVHMGSAWIPRASWPVAAWNAASE